MTGIPPITGIRHLRPFTSTRRINPLKEVNRARTEIVEPKKGIFKFGDNEDWAKINERNGHLATAASAIGLISGTAQSFFVTRDEGDPNTIANFLNFVETCSNTVAGISMYGIYGRDDDDLGQNKVEEKEYDNKTSVAFGQTACIAERRINPIVKTISCFLPKDIQEAINELASLPVGIWWRGRYSPFINQRIGTEAIKYIFHKIPAMFGRKESQKVINQIKDDGILELGYVATRILKLFGYDDKQKAEYKSFVKYLFHQVKNLNSNNAKRREGAIKSLGDGTAAFFGTVGLIALTVGSGLGSIFKLSGHKSKSLNLLSVVGQGVQHVPYYPRFTLPEKEEALRLKEKNAPQAKINEHNSLYKLGTIANVANILLPVFEFVKSDNRWVNLGKSIFRQVAEKSSMMFFAKRRNVFGKEWFQDSMVQTK